MAAIVVQQARAEDAVVLRCVLCGVALGGSRDDDEATGTCGDCRKRPEARRLGMKVGAGQLNARKSAREFTDAEKSLIRKVHGYMQPAQLLAILNERLACDLGPDALPYTMEQLHAEIGVAADMPKGGSQDWASLRKLLAAAKRNGVLDKINEQVVHDFAVVFQLNAKQLMSIKDIVLREGEES